MPKHGMGLQWVQASWYSRKRFPLRPVRSFFAAAASGPARRNLFPTCCSLPHGVTDWAAASMPPRWSPGPGRSKQKESTTTGAKDPPSQTSQGVRSPRRRTRVPACLPAESRDVVCGVPGPTCLPHSPIRTVRRRRLLRHAPALMYGPSADRSASRTGKAIARRLPC